jgi:hypothetical protein
MKDVDRRSSGMSRRDFTAAEIGRTWILDGKADVEIRGEREIGITALKPMALWCPAVFSGRVVVEFKCLVPGPGTKLLLFLYGLGADGAFVGTWPRDGAYDGYNTGRMEVYSIAFNRGPHISGSPVDSLANVRRIGGPGFGKYTSAAFRRHGTGGLAPSFWDEWNTLSLLGAALEPARGVGAMIRYRVTAEPPHLFLEANGVTFAEIVDHRPYPLVRGSVGFRCMTEGTSFVLRDVAIDGCVS